MTMLNIQPGHVYPIFPNEIHLVISKSIIIENCWHCLELTTGHFTEIHETYFCRLPVNLTTEDPWQTTVWNLPA